MEDAIAFCIFNRPDLTAQVFETIRAARPRRLLVIADGPRVDRAGEAGLVAAARRVVERVDWPCEVQWNAAEENLGCRRRISSGLSWAFREADPLIVLEDDCLPGPGFFPFIRELLVRYADDQRVMMVSGNYLHPRPVTGDSYYFSRWTHIWGWGSWRRAWNLYDPDLSTWPAVRAAGLLTDMVDGGAEEVLHWGSVFDQVHAGAIDTWDFSWQYACWLNSGLVALPNVNLVTNIGFRSDGTHTRDAGSPLAGLPAGELGPLRHPPGMVRNRTADRLTWERFFRPPTPARAGRSRLPFWRRLNRTRHPAGGRTETVSSSRKQEQSAP